MEDQRLRRRAAGVIGLAAVAAVVLALVGVYMKAFTSTVDVTVVSDRAGLLLERGSAVRVFGLPVGEVRGSTLRADGRVAIDVALDRDLAADVPLNVTAAIRSTTVFGAKFIDLQVPEHPAGAISAGTVINAEAVTTEANDVFQHAIEVLRSVDVGSLNATLNQTARALNGRGELLGDFLTQVDTYLRAFNPHVPQLTSDARHARTVLATYTAVLPDLVAASRSASTTSITLDENLASLDAFLLDIVGTSRSVGSFLDVLEEPLVQTITEITPVTDLLRVYSPEVGCLIDTLSDNQQVVTSGLGNIDAGIQGKAAFLPGQDTYTLEANLPKIVTGVGPICYPSPSRAMPLLPHVRFDDGTISVYDGIGPTVDPGTLDNPWGNPRTTTTGNPEQANALTDYLALVNAYFGSDGVNRVLAALGLERP